MPGSGSVFGRVDCNGNELAYRLRRGAGASVIFLHGLGCSKETFDQAFAPGQLPEDCTLLSVDLPGHGESFKSENFSYELDEQAGLLAGMVMQFELRTPVIVGHSMGGAIAILLAEILGDVSALFSLEGNLMLDDCTLSKRIAAVEEEHFVKRIFPMAPLKFRCRGLDSDPVTSPWAFHRCARSLVHWCSEGTLLERFRQLGLPMTYLYGEKNSPPPLVRRLTGLEALAIPASGHFMMIDNPQDTYRFISRRLPTQA